MILSYRAGRYGRLDTLNSKIHPLFQILVTDPGWCKNSGIFACKNSGAGAAGAAGEAGAGGVQLACRMGFFHVDSETDLDFLCRPTNSQIIPLQKLTLIVFPKYKK